MKGWRHAFAVDPPGPAEPDEMQRDVIDRLCRAVVRRQMTTPALFALEMSRPLNYMGSQAMHFFRPIVSTLFDTARYQALAEFLEKRGSVEYVCRRLEAMEEEAVQRESGGADAEDAGDGEPKETHDLD